MDVYVVERKHLPKVNVTIASRAGSVADPQDIPGLASMGATTMLRGTKTRTALEIDNGLGDLGTGLSSFTNREYASVGLDVLKANLAPALTVLADVVRNPNFPAEEVERERKKALDRWRRPRMIQVRSRDGWRRCLRSAASTPMDTRPTVSVPRLRRSLPRN